MSNHIIFRLLSEEDRIAVENFNPGIEPVSLEIPYYNVVGKYCPFDLQKILTKEHLTELKKEAKAFPGKTSEKLKFLDKLKTKKATELASTMKLFFKVNMYPSFYPITSGDELTKKELTVNQYLDVSGAWGGVRTTHGIHGFFTYDTDDRRTREPYFYDDYGYWDGVRPRETGGNLRDEPKHIFINKFKAVDNNGGLSSVGNFDKLFYKYDISSGENVTVNYIDCKGGEATYTMGDDKGGVTFGDSATCDGFEGVIDEDKIRYARLGKLMPSLSLTEYSDRKEEINFRGKGAMTGFHVKMPECSFDYATLDGNRYEHLDKVVEETNQTLEGWRQGRQTKQFHKGFFGEIHKGVLEYFKEELENGEDSSAFIFDLIGELSSEGRSRPSMGSSESRAKKRRK